MADVVRCNNSCRQAAEGMASIPRPDGLPTGVAAVGGGGGASAGAQERVEEARQALNHDWLRVQERGTCERSGNGCGINAPYTSGTAHVSR